MSVDRLQGGMRFGRYEVESLLGEGGAGAVYVVRHVELRTEFALKVLHASQPKMRDRLLREGRIQASLRHPHVVPVHDVLTVHGEPALVMDYVRGPSLERLVQQQALSLDQVDVLARGILRGMRAVHRRGLVHRDLKPGNVLIEVTEEGPVAKVTDFGIAKAELRSDDLQTRTGTVMGTPLYMSPEQIRDTSNVGPASDVWSLGVMLYELLCGQRPFDSGDRLALFNAIANGHHTPLAARTQGLPDRMLTAVEHALQVHVSRRYPDAGALLEAWEGAAAAPSLAHTWGGDTLATMSSMAPSAHQLTPYDGASVPPRTTGETKAPVEPIPATTPAPLSSAPMLGEHTPDPVAAPHPAPGQPVAAAPSAAPAQPPNHQAATGWRSLAPPLLGLAALAAAGWVAWPATTPLPAPSPVVGGTPVPSPAPAAAPDRVEPTPTTEPTAQPTPTTEPTAQPTPAPSTKRSPSAARPIAPTPTPEPSPAPGLIRVTGDAALARVVFQSRDGTRTERRQLPPGGYAVFVVFEGYAQEMQVAEVKLAAGEEIQLDCRAATMGCAVR